MRRITVAALAIAMVAAGAPVADAHHKGLRHNAHHSYWECVRAVGASCGRNIITRGVKYPGHHSRPARIAEVARWKHRLDSLAAPAPPFLLRTAQPPSQQPGGVKTAGVAPGGKLQSIASCESGGNPRAISPGGKYRGKYQFDYSTWGSVGGSGDPAAAPEAEQDRRAAMLLQRSGTRPWPNCG